MWNCLDFQCKLIWGWLGESAWVVLQNAPMPFKSRESHFFAELFNPITRQARELSKPSTDSASLLIEIEKNVFRFRFGVRWGGRYKWVCYCFFCHLYLALDSNPLSRYFGSRFVWKLRQNPRLQSPWMTFEHICSRNYGQKKQKFVKISAPTNPIWGGIHPFSKWPSLASGSSYATIQIRSEWGKTCSLGWKKEFSPCDFGLSGYVYKTTGCFDRFLKTFHDANVPWELENRAESVARNRAIFKCILGYSTSFQRFWWTF